MRSLAAVLLLLVCACPSRTPRPEGPVTTPPGPSDAAAPPSGDPFAALAPPKLPSPPVEPEGPQPEAIGAPKADEVAIAFPPTEAPPPPRKVEPPPLAVVRAHPKGREDLVGSVVAAFNQPMVPVASVGDVNATEPPLKIEPLPPGRFRWIDTQTISFEPVDRLPLATRYRARIPAGVKSALGTVLSAEYAWDIETARPRVVESLPPGGGEQVRPDALVMLRFNAAVNPADVLRVARLRAKGREVPIELVAHATEEGAKAGKSRLPGGWEPERSVILRAKAPLALATQHVLTISKELRSTEGPLPPEAPFDLAFTTYRPLAVEEIGCGEDECDVPGPVGIRFNNEIIEDQKLADFVQVTPTVEELEVEYGWNGIEVKGAFKPSSRYTVRVAAGVEDAFGQKLAAPVAREVRFRALRPMGMLAGSDDRPILEPRFGASIDVIAVNLTRVRARIAAVPAAKYLGVNSMLREFDGKAPQLRELPAAWSGELAIAGRRDEFQRVPVELALALGSKGRGAALVEVDFPELDDRSMSPVTQRALLQVTNLGLAAAIGESSVHALVARFDDGAPVADATVELLDGGGAKIAEAKTDARGYATLPGPATLARSTPWLLVARTNDDESLLVLNGQSRVGEWVSSFTGGTERKSLTGFAFAERGAFRPGETAHVSVIARVPQRGPEGVFEVPPEAARTLEWELRSPRWETARRGSVQLSAFGTASVPIAIAADAALGEWRLVFRSRAFDSDIVGQFEVKEYRPAEFRVKVDHDAPGPVFARDRVTFRTEAEYLFGAPMAGASMQWTLSSSRAWFAPPGHPEFSFEDLDMDSPYPWLRRDDPDDESPSESGSGELDAKGRLATPMPLDHWKLRGPVTFTFESTVVDQNRQALSGRTSILSHKASRYAGIRLGNAFVRAGETISPQLIVTDLDGRLQRGVPVTVSLLKRERVPKKKQAADEDPDVHEEGEPREEWAEVEIAKCEAKSDDKPVTCGLRVAADGLFLARATIADEKGRKSSSAVRVWAFGPNPWLSGDDEPVISLALDRGSYAAGETAKLLVRSPFTKARGLLLLARDGVAEARPIVVENGSLLLDVPLKEAWIPQVNASVVLFRGRESEPKGDDPGRPRVASASLEIPIDRASRRIEIGLKPATRVLAPRGELRIALTTSDAKARPISANVALMVVDEGVLSLTDFQTPNPLEALYQPRGANAGIAESWSDVLARVDVRAGLQGFEFGFGGLGGRGGGSYGLARKMAFAEAMPADGAPEGASFEARSLFATTAYFDGSIVTDADGRAEVTVKMPDNLTEFRVMAVAADAATRFGSADTTVRVRKPLLVRPSLPRFLNVGDRFEASAVIHNETGADADVEVRLLAANAKVLKSRARLPLKAGEAREVRLPVEAGAPGPAKFQFAAVALTKSRPTDAAEVTIPIRVPASAEAFATYGVVEESIRQPIVAPANAMPGFGGLDVHLSSTALTGLNDAVSYLVEYPFECVEQTSSRLVALAALKDVLVPLRLGGIADEATRAELAKRAVARILEGQRSDGGFGLWPGARESSMFLTAYALQALHLAWESGTHVDEGRLKRAVEFVVRRLAKPSDKWDERPAAQALAAYVLSRMGRPSLVELERLADRKDLPLFATAWIYEALAMQGPTERTAELGRRLANAAVESAGSLHFAESKSEDLRLLMHSDDRTDAIVLRALIVADPKDANIEKLARGLMRSRVRGRWSTTQANSYALLALRDYFRAYESEPPAFDARAWVGASYVGGRRFAQRETTIARVSVPLATLASTPGDLVLAKYGPGRLYYRVGLRYAPADLRLKAQEQGFAITRTYEAADADAKVSRDADGTWRIKAGSNVRVRLRIVVPDRRYYAAVVDPLPAGFEVIDPALATSARAGSGDAHGFGWWRPPSAWNHQELRDDRVQLFADALGAGVYDHAYLARATAPGTFVAPPSHVEEMYAPETFGRAATDAVVIE